MPPPPPANLPLQERLLALAKTLQCACPLPRGSPELAIASNGVAMSLSAPGYRSFANFSQSPGSLGKSSRNPSLPGLEPPRALLSFPAIRTDRPRQPKAPPRPRQPRKEPSPRARTIRLTSQQPHDPHPRHHSLFLLMAAHELLQRHGPVLLPHILYRCRPHLRHRRLQDPARPCQDRQQEPAQRPRPGL